MVRKNDLCALVADMRRADPIPDRAPLQATTWGRVVWENSGIDPPAPQ